VLDLLEQLDVVRRAEGRLADGHLVQNRTNGPQVCLGVVLLVAEDFWCHV
jgi:hypothetical protein